MARKWKLVRKGRYFPENERLRKMRSDRRSEDLERGGTGSGTDPLLYGSKLCCAHRVARRQTERGERADAGETGELDGNRKAQRAANREVWTQDERKRKKRNGRMMSPGARSEGGYVVQCISGWDRENCGLNFWEGTVVTECLGDAWCTVQCIVY